MQPLPRNRLAGRWEAKRLEAPVPQSLISIARLTLSASSVPAAPDSR